MKKLLVITLVVSFAMTACQKGPVYDADVSPASIDAPARSVSTVRAFYAAMTADGPTKTTMLEGENGSFYHFWYGGEPVAIYNGSACATYESDIDHYRGEDECYSTDADLKIEEGKELEEADRYLAWSPAGLVLHDDFSGPGSLTLPSKQSVYLEYPGEFCDSAPLIAVSGTRNFSFANLCGYVELNLKAGGGTDIWISSITLHADKALSGPFTYDSEAANSIEMAESMKASGTEGDVVLTVEPEEGGDYAKLSSDTYTPFIIAVPPGDYDSFVITVNGALGIMRREVSRTFTAKKTIHVERAKITDINLTLKFPVGTYLPDGIYFSAGREYSWDKVAGGEDNASNKIKKIVFETNSTVSSGMILWQAYHSLVSDCYIYARFDDATGTATLSTAADTIKVYDAHGLFGRLYNLETVEGIEHLDTQEVKDMGSMFSNCRKLTSLDLKSFSVENVTSFNQMFSECEALASLDLSTWKTTSLINTYQMLGNCQNVSNLNLGPDFTLSAECYKNGMCNSLGESLKTCTITCSAATKEALLEKDPNNTKYAITRLGNMGNVTYTWNIVE